MNLPTTIHELQVKEQSNARDIMFLGACWDNAVVERFFGSLKHDWIFKVAQPTRDFMKQDGADYIRYDNQGRLDLTRTNL